MQAMMIPKNSIIKIFQFLFRYVTFAYRYIQGLIHIFLSIFFLKIPRYVTFFPKDPTNSLFRFYLICLRNLNGVIQVNNMRILSGFHKNDDSCLKFHVFLYLVQSLDKHSSCPRHNISITWLSIRP